MSDNPVMVVGSGLAGLMTALTLAPLPVLLVTAGGLGLSGSSELAQGGIAASIAADDNAVLHLADTLAAGDGLCDAGVAAGIIEAGPEIIAALEAHGVRFDRKADGSYALGLEAAHSRHRIAHVDGDATGAGIMRALTAKVRATPSITVMENTRALRLMNRDGRVVGAVLENYGPVAARAVVLATGGIGGLYTATTTPLGNLGQGAALAGRAGAVLADMEFVQFHPTALAVSAPRLPLVSEAVRGEGAILVNDCGERFMADIPGRELASRDVVARAIGAEIARGRQVFLDARAALGPRFASRFPASTGFAGSTVSIRRTISFRCGPPRITTWAVWRRMGTGARACPAFGPWAKPPAPACMAQTALPAIRCWKRLSWGFAPVAPSRTNPSCP